MNEDVYKDLMDVSAQEMVEVKANLEKMRRQIDSLDRHVSEMIRRINVTMAAQ